MGLSFLASDKHGQLLDIYHEAQTRGFYLFVVGLSDDRDSLYVRFDGQKKRKII